jgi:hypothetical protein
VGDTLNRKAAGRQNSIWIATPKFASIFYGPFPFSRARPQWGDNEVPSMTQVANFVPLADRHRQFVVAQNARGRWVARETTGMIEGVFREQRDAVRFALYETGDPRSVVVISGGSASARAA